MSDRLERETIKKLTSVSSVLKNPYKNLEDILTQLGEIDEDLQYKRDGVYEKDLEFHTVGEKARKALIEAEEEVNYPGESLTKVLSDLGEMFKVCGICGKGIIENELVSGVCFDCYRKGEVIHAQNRKIGELEAQVRNMESKLGNPRPRDYMGDIIDEILVTIRKDIEHDLKSIKSGLSSVQRIPPPPPPPKTNTQDNGLFDSNDLDFSNMTLADLKNYTPEFLSELPLSLRNQYNTRLKELQLIEKMTQKQKKEYFRKKRKKQEQAADLDELRDSLKNLSESNNPLFLKMKKQAEKSVLVGSGTLGNFGQKRIFINCHKCNTTNKIIEGKKSLCKKCRTPLRV
ncbi:MAG: hypothetical protein JSU57_00915 [Candidatus Heimdallarchaeota archaeon]|nr:MAG: hypothetical protein JSU57_00915 [Candidatus Heimdallarchaeota archaeon]